MFGSKIRSWMDSIYIVRSKKKSNKSKNANNGNLLSANPQNGYKGTAYQTETGIGSPARRSEISPIQNNKTSRRGWQSPNQEIEISADNYAPVLKAKGSAQSVAPKSSHTLTVESAYSSTKATPAANNYLDSRYLTSTPTTMYQVKEVDRNLKASEAAQKGAMKNMNNNGYYNRNSLNYATSNSSSNELLDDNVLSNRTKYIPIDISSSSSSVNSSIANKQNETNNNIISTKTISYGFSNSKNDPKYGKIQPIKTMPMEKYGSPMNNVDHFNGNSVEHEVSHQSSFKRQPVHPPNQQMVINSRYRNGNMLTTVSNRHYHHPLVHHQIPNHAVSSPESAYSTGYSTDGTSPGGCSYTPEYYINIRTGTHYFPKCISSADSANRFKSGLNRIEEKNGEIALDDEHNQIHKIAEAKHFKQQKMLNTTQIPKYDCRPRTTATTNPFSNNVQANSGEKTVNQLLLMSPMMVQKNVAVAPYFRTPSPRQRCRIRTNPWFSNADPIIVPPFNARKDLDSGSTSSGIKSNSDESNEKILKNIRNNSYLSESDSSSSTEKNASRTLVSITEKRYSKREDSRQTRSNPHGNLDSEDDATLNEMMGKFDESYVYEKETDILSDSDPTDHGSDLDTGLDAEDECESTDDLLDIDFIDNGSVQEVLDRKFKNTGNCSYHHYQPEKKVQKQRKVIKNDELNVSQKRRKKTTKKKVKTSDKGSRKESPIMSNRGCRSVGGTPISIRRHQKQEKKQPFENQLATRSNSLTFHEIDAIRNRMLAISESEKALIKADLEADIKYKQLIHEAENILISMKTKAVKDPPLISPRRACNVPTNKRVEMLRNCEVDLKRELTKTSYSCSTTTFNKLDECHQPTLDKIVVNKRLEILRYETVSAPNSPKSTRVTPIKTHLTNFICQNSSPEDMLRRRNVPESPTNPRKSPQLQLNGRSLNTPRSPAPTRKRFTKQKQQIDSESDSDNVTVNKDKENNTKRLNKVKINASVEINVTSERPPLLSFRSVDIGNNIPEDSFFPQSEPLKRKIYTCSSTYDKIQRSLDFDSDVPKKALLNKIQVLRRERQVAKLKAYETTEMSSSQDQQESSEQGSCENLKRKLIMKTIEDIKRSLEEQSLELNELHDSDN